MIELLVTNRIRRVVMLGDINIASANLGHVYVVYCGNSKLSPV